MKRRNNYPPPRKPSTARRNIIPSSFSPSTRATGSANLTRFIFFAGAYLVASTLLLVRYLYVIPIPTSLPIFEKEVTVEWWHARQFLRDFVGLPEEHNTTVDGFSIPGPFYQDKLYLVGARLTTSFEANNDNVYATLFMMPGDFWHRKKEHKIRCAVNALSNGDNGTLLSHNKVIETLKIYVEVTGCLTCGGPIAMEYIPSIHADANVVNVTMIWTADLSPFVKRTHLSRILKETERTTTSSMEKAIRLSFSLEDDDKRNFQLTPGKRLTHLATVDIPLSTGVVGHGGPQIRSPFSNFTNKGETLQYRINYLLR
mmetsp:Transcript_4095/g.6833  ORF Transcript_4095/g.6833 Transcript_4095/m.6833 type:complete len:314 (+) Transcript_4095:107-1048(+)